MSFTRPFASTSTSTGTSTSTSTSTNARIDDIGEEEEEHGKVSKEED